MLVYLYLSLLQVDANIPIGDTGVPPIIPCPFVEKPNFYSCFWIDLVSEKLTAEMQPKQKIAAILANLSISSNLLNHVKC